MNEKSDSMEKKSTPTPGARERRASNRVWSRRRVNLASGQSLYNYFRDYDPSTGRYVQSDPIGLAGGLSTFGYVGGSPLNSIDPFGLEIEYANHPVAFGLAHSKIVITPVNQGRYQNDPRFQNIDASGMRFATIGAGPRMMMLEYGANRPRDVGEVNANRQSLKGLNQCFNEDSAIQRLFELAENYNNQKLEYTLKPIRIFGIPTGYNSNSFISGLGIAAGFAMPAPQNTGANTPGYQNPVPAYRFER